MYIYKLERKYVSILDNVESNTQIITEDIKQFSDFLEKERKEYSGYDYDLEIEIWSYGSLVFNCSFNTYYFSPSSELDRFHRWQKDNI